MAEIHLRSRHRPSEADIVPAGLRRVVMVVEYDGTAYSGWQRQANAPSVQQCMEEAFTALTGEQVPVIGCSRTDAGVHALGLVCHMDTGCRIPSDRLPYALNTKLPWDIRVRAARVAPPGFHARFSTCAKVYRYTFYNSRQMCAVGRQYAAHVPKEMEDARIHLAVRSLLGTHDFRAFAASGNESKTTVRTMYAIRLWREGEKVIFRIMGDGFLYNMVRIIAGTLSEIGTGKRPPSCIREAVETGSRLCLGMTAPACGLMLERVLYEGDEGVIPELFDPEQSGVYYSGSGKE